MKIIAIPPLSVAILLLSGCASSFDAMRGAVNQTPDWYEARRKEVRGDGYPEIADVPTVDAKNPPGKGLAIPGKRVATLRAEFEANPRATVTEVDLARAQALITSVQQAFVALDTPANMLSRAEISAIRASFDVPRVTESTIVRP